MKHIIAILFTFYGFLPAERASAQFVLDTLLTVEGEVSRSLFSENSTIHWFTHHLANANYKHRVIDSTGANLRESTFDTPFLNSSFLFKQKVGAFYYTLVQTENLTFYRSNNDSTLGNLVASHTMIENGYIVDFRQTAGDEILVLLNIVPEWKPAVVRFVPSTTSISYFDLSQRNGYTIGGVDLQSLVRISNSRLLLSCHGCKRYLNNGSWQSTNHADWAIYDNNFVFLQDSVPLYTHALNFPFGSIPIDGPKGISNTLTLPSGNLVFLGTRTRIGASNLIPYIAKWSPQLASLQQMTFGDTILHYVFPDVQTNYLIQGYDGFLYVFMRIMTGQNAIEPRGLLIAKLDTSLNLIDQKVLMRSSQYSPMYSVSLTANPGGVYFLVNDTANSHLIRIRNSEGLGLGINSMYAIMSSEIYPNPTSGTSLLWKGSAEAATFRWYNFQGKLIYEQNLHGSMQHELDIQNLNAGLYFLCAFSLEGYSFNPQKVVIR